MFLEAITTDDELELLRILGIELIDGKLINTETDEIFVEQKSDERFEHLYKCGNITVKFTDCHSPYVLITKDGLTYLAGEQKKLGDYYLGRYLYINSVNDKVDDRHRSQGIIIEPEVDRDFMITSITFNNSRDTYVFRDRINIKCDFNSIKVITYDNNGGREINCGEISEGTYRSILESSINSSYKDEKLRNAYLRCMPFILNEFKTLLAFPSYADILFEREVTNELERIDTEISSSIRFFLPTRDYALNNLDKTDKTEAELNLEQTKIYVNSALELDARVRKLMANRQERKKELDAYLDDVRAYRDNYLNRKK